MIYLISVILGVVAFIWMLIGAARRIRTNTKQTQTSMKVHADLEKLREIGGNKKRK